MRGDETIRQLMQLMYRIRGFWKLAVRKAENKDGEKSFQTIRSLGRFRRIEKRRGDKETQADAVHRIYLRTIGVTCLDDRDVGGGWGLRTAAARLGLYSGSHTLTHGLRRLGFESVIRMPGGWWLPSRLCIIFWSGD